MKKLTSWFEIDEKEYMWYILQGYEIIANRYHVAWRFDGNYHRIDGPAIICKDETLFWCLNGFEYSEEEFKHKNNI